MGRSLLECWRLAHLRGPVWRVRCYWTQISHHPRVYRGGLRVDNLLLTRSAPSCSYRKPDGMFCTLCRGEVSSWKTGVNFSTRDATERRQWPGTIPKDVNELIVDEGQATYSKTSQTWFIDMLRPSVIVSAFWCSWTRGPVRPECGQPGSALSPMRQVLKKSRWDDSWLGFASRSRYSHTVVVWE